ncbi:unnamed protein product [Symbiodinium natans]|uniref:Steroid 5-alpha reductase C-terminal domain-containing protein n=1 Tax=Symbiodinium natans TaxID=878477 RepID=A0A812UY25_9DINO|nr:unnamed protein product [Symbiodinium natans]
MSKPLEQPLAGTSAETCCCGLDRDLRKWIQWRSPTGNTSSADRLPWQAGCSVLLLLEMASYFYFVLESPVLLLIGSIFVVKALVEIWGQQTPTWLCPGTFCMLFVIYVLIVPTVAYMYGYCTMASDIQFAGRDWLGLVLYLGGSSYSLFYEAQPENKGKLHTVGPAAWCMHPNYFGDLFTYTGWGLACGTSCALSIPIMMIFTFVIIVVPNSDRYLAQRYPEEFPAYAAKTATLIPGLHSELASKILAWACLVVCVYLWCNTCSAPCGL